MNISKQRSLALSKLIQQEIAGSHGHISFARFMEMALYTPELGYYSSSSPKFGQSGDFMTAPELTSLFAKSIARQISQILKLLEGGDILEIGAGSGKLASDLLQELEHLGSLPRHYFIYDKSTALRSEQKKLLNKNCPHLMNKVHWLDELPGPSKLSGVILANEVLDAQPVHCFQIGNHGLSERSVAFDHNQFYWKMTPPTTPELTRRVNLILHECPITPDYQSEINLTLYEWIPKLANNLAKGVILLFDYGYGRREYYHPDRNTGTLMCYHQHTRQTDPFQFIGLQDITAHVDFTAVIESAIDANLRLGGYTTQSAFLLSSGLLNLAQENELTAVDQYQQNQAIKMLTLPSQMGELIKAMALTKNFPNTLLGFSLHDRRRSL